MKAGYKIVSLQRELGPLLSLSLPVIAAEVGWVTMQIVDIGMVGQLGPEAIGAVGVGSALFLALAVVGIGLLLGLDPLIAQAFGAQRFTECRVWARHGIVLAVALTFPLTLVAWILQRAVFTWGFDVGVVDLVRDYLKVVTWSLLPLLIFTVLRRYLQSVGMVKPIMFTLLTANIANAIANWLFVFGNWGFPALGVEGAAWATCVSRSYMCGLLAFSAWRARNRFYGNGLASEPSDIRFDFGRLRRLIQLGWPAAAQMTLEVGVFAVVTALAGRLEPHLLAAHQIVLNIVSLTFMVTYGVSAAGAVRVGHAIGRKEPAAARYSGWLALAIGAGFMCVAAVVFLAIPRPILRSFTTDVGVMETGVILLAVAAVFQLFDGVQAVATGVLRGLGDTLTPMLCNLAGHWMIGLPVGYGLCFWLGWGVVGLWVGWSVGLILVALLLVPVWHRRIEAVQHSPAMAGNFRP